MNRWLRRGIMAVLVVAVALASIALSLWITPMHTVSAAGQTIRVGATAPSWSLAGPGELDLFGQRIPTTIDFAGPVRPRLALSHITLGAQLNQFAGNGAAGAAHALQEALVDGWTHFFAWQIVVCGAIALVLFGALAGWLRHRPGRTIALIATGVVLTEALNVGGVMVTAYTAPEKLAAVNSLQDLVGGAPPPAVTGKDQAAHTEIRHVAVIGDSTAAGLGNAPVAKPTPDDKSCGRSRDAFAVELARANDWDVTNLACSSATIRDGLLGPQHVRDRIIPPQVDSPAVKQADLVVVSIGANDVHWSLLLQLCAVTPDCSNAATLAYFQQQLSVFSRDLLQLATQLQLLPNHPVVIVNQYYDPFTGDMDCLADHGLTKDKKKSMTATLDALNDTLASAAKTAGFHVAHPDFSGHGLCSDQPWVQGPGDAAPFHPTAGGELAIALADEDALDTAPAGR